MELQRDDVDERLILKESVIDKLLPYQLKHTVEQLQSIINHGVCLNVSGTGAGKSYIVAAICVQLGLQPFFVGPKSGIPNLYKVCDFFEISSLGNVNYESIKNGMYYTSLDNYYAEDREECPYVEMIYEDVVDYITNVKVLKKNGEPKRKLVGIEWNLPENTLVVFDEVHRARNGLSSGVATGNSKLLTSFKKYINIGKKIYCAMLSATLTDKLENFDVIAYVLGLYKPYQTTIYNQFIKRNSKIKRGVDYDDEFDPDQIVYKNIHDLIFPEYASGMEIVKIKSEGNEAGDGYRSGCSSYSGNYFFRENDVKAEIYPISKKSSIEIEENNKKIQEAMSSNREKGLGHGWAEVIRYWQRIEILKVPVVIDLIREYIKVGMNIVIFVNFIETAELIMDQLMSKSIIDYDKIGNICGGQSARDREEVVEKFQKNILNVIISNIKAGGVSISLHDLFGKQRASIIFPTWSATDLKQALGRIYRAGAKSDSIQRIVYCKYNSEDEDDSRSAKSLSIEEYLCANVNKKLQNIEMFNTGDLYNVSEI